MKGAVLLGLLVGFIGMMFLPYIFGLISITTIFSKYSVIIQGLPNSLADLITPGFLSTKADPSFNMVGIDPNIIAVFTGGSFLYFVPPMLAWIVGGLLAALFSQSAKKGILSAIVLIIVEFLVYLLMSVIAGVPIFGTTSQSIINTTSLTSMYPFIGGDIITPVCFGVLGGLIGGFISRFAFGPEEI
jgi:hypothetical protein